MKGEDEYDGEQVRKKNMLMSRWRQESIYPFFLSVSSIDPPYHYALLATSVSTIESSEDLFILTSPSIPSIEKWLTTFSSFSLVAPLSLLSLCKCGVEPEGSCPYMVFGLHGFNSSRVLTQSRFAMNAACMLRMGEAR